MDIESKNPLDCSDKSSDSTIVMFVPVQHPQPQDMCCPSPPKKVKSDDEAFVLEASSAIINSSGRE